MNRASGFENFVGLLVLLVAGGFLTYAYTVNGASVGQEKYTLDAVFGQVDGITVGSEIRIAGVKVGTVSGNRLDPMTYEATVQLTLDKEVAVPEDSVAKIVSDGLLGGAHIAIEPGASEDYLIEGDKITYTRGSVDLINLAVQAFTSQSNDDGEAETEDDGLSIEAPSASLDGVEAEEDDPFALPEL